MAVFDTTLGGSAATSYVDTAYADAYFLGGIYENEWAVLSTAEKEAALMAATSVMETLRWNGTRCSPSTDDNTLPQQLSWPRSGVTCDGIAAACTFIPREVRDSSCRLALQLHTAPPPITPPTGGSAGTYVSNQTLGDLSISYAAYPSNTAVGGECETCSDPLAIREYPWLKSALACWIEESIGAGGSGILKRVRS